MVVRERCVAVRVGVGRGDGAVVRVLVMGVVNVQVVVLGCLVGVNMTMSGSRDHQNACKHGRARDDVRKRRPIAEDRDGEKRSDEGRGREDCGFARSPQQAERVHVQD